MQKIERKHLTLRTRLKRLTRKTLSFSRSCLMHDLTIGLYMNYVEFGCAA
jgi:insertion element IS1 protein InsB